MARKPSSREEYLMKILGFDSLRELEEWLNQPEDPLVETLLRPAYPEDGPEPESEASPPPFASF